MKLSRVMEILTILKSEKSAKAGELAERFGVSIRTIYRDIDSLAAAGVPVVMAKGASGGIFLNDVAELPDGAELISASAPKNNEPHIPAEEDKPTPVVRKTVTPVARGTKTKEAPDIAPAPPEATAAPAESVDEPQTAAPVKSVNELSDDIHAIVSAAKRQTVPIQPVEPRKLAPPDGAETRKTTRMTLYFTPDAETRVRADFPERTIHKDFDGTIKVETEMPENEELYSYILSYGPSVKVDAPTYVRVIIRERAKKTLEQYESTEVVPQTTVWGKMKKFWGGEQ